MKGLTMDQTDAGHMDDKNWISVGVHRDTVVRWYYLQETNQVTFEVIIEGHLLVDGSMSLRRAVKENWFDSRQFQKAYKRSLSMILKLIIESEPQEEA